MKKLFVLLSAAIVMSVSYLAIEQAPTQVSLSPPEPQQAYAAHLRSLEKMSLVHELKAEEKAQQPRHHAPSAKKGAPKKQQNAQPATQLSDNKPNPAAPVVVNVRTHLKVPDAKKWIAGLSGDQVNLQIAAADKRSTDCRTTLCPERAKGHALAGIVMEPIRVVQKRKDLIDGQMANGDGNRQPYIYLK